MPQKTNISLGDWLTALMDHLGLSTAYFATAIPRDISDLAAQHPNRLAGIVLCVPSRLDPGTVCSCRRSRLDDCRRARRGRFGDGCRCGSSARQRTLRSHRI